jgi:hypothetical protein
MLDQTRGVILMFADKFNNIQTAIPCEYHGKGSVTEQSEIYWEER